MDFQKLNKSDSDLDRAINLIVMCLSKVHTKEETFIASELEHSDIEDFVSNFNQEQFSKLIEFMDTMPKLSTKIDFNCSHCSHKQEYTIQGMQDFF
jgi:hypothetical protein